MTENKQMNVAIYLRVSTDEQIKGYGLTVQEEKLKAFIKSQEYVLDEKHIYREEGFSGTLPIEARPQLKLLFEDAKNKKFDVVLVYRIDRFFRKTRLLLEAIEQLDKQKIGFRSISEAFDTTNSAGRFMTTLLGGVAEMERDTIRERTMSGKLSAARAGKWTTGVPPYGYKVNPETKKLLLVENEASVVKQFYEWIVYERLSLGKVAERANNLGINSPKHTTIKKRKTHNFWYKRTIGRLLTNEIYTGTTYFRKYKRPFNNLTSLVSSELQRPKEDWVKIIVPPVISVDLFEKAKQQLLKNREMSSRNTKRQYLYTKIIYCGACGFKMFSGFQPARKERGGVGTKYYHGTHRKKDAVGTTKRCFK
jgi:site-specific DNA recombinase